MKLYIKNMVCNRCKMVVKSELEKAGLHPISVELGEAEVGEELTAEQTEKVKERLQKNGFALIDDKRSRLIEKIKNAVVALVHYNNDDLRTNLSNYLSQQLHYDYNYLSNLFSEIEGITIEKYFISQKIEKVKELLMYDEMSLSEIADKLGYSSVAYLSNQFKKQTGLTPTFYKNLKKKNRLNLDDL